MTLYNCLPRLFHLSFGRRHATHWGHRRVATNQAVPFLLPRSSMRAPDRGCMVVTSQQTQACGVWEQAHIVGKHSRLPLGSGLHVVDLQHMDLSHVAAWGGGGGHDLALQDRIDDIFRKAPATSSRVPERALVLPNASSTSQAVFRYELTESTKLNAKNSAFC